MADPELVEARLALESVCAALTVALRFVAVHSLGDVESVVQSEAVDVLNRRKESRDPLPVIHLVPTPGLDSIPNRPPCCSTIR